MKTSTRAAIVLVVSLSSLATAACTTDGSIRDAMAGARVSRNPADGASLREIPPAPLHLTGVESPAWRARDLSFRLITHSPKETCANGDVPVPPERAKDYRFLLKSYRGEVPQQSAPSASVKVLDTTYDPDTHAPVTALQVCFADADVITKSTEYLVLQVDPSTPLARTMFAIWHFDSSVRRMQ